MLTVLSVAYPFAPVGRDAVGGAEQILTALDLALVGHGHRSIVIACAGSETAGTLIPHTLPAGPIDSAARAQVQAEVSATMDRVLQDTRVDLVHMHGIDFDCYLPPPGPPCLATLHLPPDWYAATALTPARADTWVHCVSAAQHRACPPSPALLGFIPNGVAVDALGNHPHAPRRFAISLGRICPEKGQHLALAAAHAADVPLLIGGAAFPYDSHQAYLADAVQPLLDRRRRWLGPVGFARKKRLLAAASCLLVPSLAQETSSLVTMEALACGTPVIAFPAGALPDLVEHGRTGFLVQDVAEMAAAIRRVGELDRALCRAVARDRFSEARMTAAYLQRYADLAGRAA